MAAKEAARPARRRRGKARPADEVDGLWVVHDGLEVVAPVGQ
jgi:hypothetical protein